MLFEAPLLIHIEDDAPGRIRFIIAITPHQHDREIGEIERASMTIPDMPREGKIARIIGKTCMVYSEHLAARVRDALPDRMLVEEKKMMGGLIFMVEGNMCVGIVKDDLMVRCALTRQEMTVPSTGYHAMEMAGRPMHNFFIVDADVLEMEEDLAYWLELALDFNKTAKPSRKRRT